MLHIGCHLSSSKGFAAMGKTALAIGADTFAFFTRNPRGSRAKAIDPKDVEKFQALWAPNRSIPLVAHAPYTLNPASSKEDVRTFAQETIGDDLEKWKLSPAIITICIRETIWVREQTPASSSSQPASMLYCPGRNIPPCF